MGTLGGSIRLGDEGGFWIRGVHLGGGGGSLLGKTVSGGMGWLRLGYAFDVGGFRLMPVAFGGMGGVAIEIREKAQIPFDQLSITPALETKIATDGGLVGGALELSKLVGGGLWVGLSAGFLQGAGGWRKWEGANAILQGGPSIRPFIAFLRLQVGGGGFYQKDKN